MHIELREPLVWSGNRKPGSARAYLRAMQKIQNFFDQCQTYIAISSTMSAFTTSQVAHAMMAESPGRRFEIAFDRKSLTSLSLSWSFDVVVWYWLGFPYCISSWEGLKLWSNRAILCLVVVVCFLKILLSVWPKIEMNQIYLPDVNSYHREQMRPRVTDWILSSAKRFLLLMKCWLLWSVNVILK